MKVIATRSQYGSVLMETVIAIPLFMLLIGGIMWIGQLIYDKQKLIVADRYVAWNYGNWHGANWGDVQSRFFGTAVSETAVPPQAQTVNQNPWWRLVSGDASLLFVWMPPWTRGWLTADAIVKRQPVTIAPFISNLSGRDLPSGQAGGHFVVMRTPQSGWNDTRMSAVYPGDVYQQFPPPQLSMDYQGIFNEDWAPGRSTNQ